MVQTISVSDNVQFGFNYPYNGYTPGPLPNTNSPCMICGQYHDTTIGCYTTPYVYNYPYTYTTPKKEPHVCLICQGKTKVKFNPENPFKESDGCFPCKACGETGLLWY